MSVRSLVLRLVPAFLWAGAIFAVSSIPLGSFQAPFAHADKLAHMAEYAILAVLVTAGLHLGGVRRLFLRAASSVPIMALVAAADELHQRWIPGRSPDGLDLLADLIGILVGAGIVLVTVWGRNRKVEG